MNLTNVNELIIKYRLIGLYVYIKLKLGLTKKIQLPKIKFPIYLRKKTSDIPVFHQIFTSEEYAMTTDFKVNFIIDAGANIGLSAIFFANKHPEAKILSIEPGDENYQILLKNVSYYENIIPLKCALFNKTCDLEIQDKNLGEFGYVVEEMSKINNDSTFVKAITIDEIVTKYKLKFIDILKIDIEGSEKELFSSNFENWLPCVKCLVIELHDDMKPGASNSFFSAISKYNFSFGQRGENLIFTNQNIKEYTHI